jgi:hypothetical protein
MGAVRLFVTGAQRFLVRICSALRSDDQPGSHLGLHKDFLALPCESDTSAAAPVCDLAYCPPQGRRNHAARHYGN